MKKLCFVLIMVLTAFFLMGCPNPVKEVEDVDLPTEEEVLEMYKDWYISKSNEQANLRSSKDLYTVDVFMEDLSEFSVNVKNCHLKLIIDENSLELWLENNELKGHLVVIGSNLIPTPIDEVYTFIYKEGSIMTSIMGYLMDINFIINSQILANK